jgi:plasmid maintenance system antidote protein VapI
MNRQNKKLAPVHPGEVLREEFMKPLGLSAAAVPKGLGVAPRPLASRAFAKGLNRG